MPDSKPGLQDSSQFCAINEPAVAFRNTKIQVVLSQLNITDFKSLILGYKYILYAKFDQNLHY
jgi:hypothetical protein